MGGGGIFQKTNTQGLGAGVIPSAATLNNRDYLISQGRGASWANPNARSVNPHGMSNVTGGSMGVNAAGSSTSGARWGGLIENGGVTDAWISPNFVHGEAGKRFQERYGMEHFNTDMPMDSVNDKPSYGGTRTPSTQYTADEIAALKLEYDTDEALRQDKLDRMSQLAQGKGGGTQAPRPPGQGQPGQFQVQSTPMVNLKRRFPSLEQTEGSLNPFLGRRYNK